MGSEAASTKSKEGSTAHARTSDSQRGPEAVGPSLHARVAALQEAAGNRAVGDFLRAGLQRGGEMISATSSAAAQGVEALGLAGDVPDVMGTAAEVAARRTLAALGPLEPSGIFAVADQVLRMPVVGPFVREHPALSPYRKQLAMIESAPGALEVIWDVSRNPGAYTDSIASVLAPHVEHGRALAVEEGDRLLGRLGVPPAYVDPTWKVLKVTAGAADGVVRFILNDVILDTLLFWQLRSEKELYEETWRKYEEGSIDAHDVVVEHLAMVLSVLGRAADLVPLVLSATGMAAGGAIGGTAGSVVPVAGTSAGAGGGGGAGGAGGLAISEIVGLALVLGPAALEMEKAAKAALDLALSEQDERSRQQDFGQIATSAVSLVIMGVLAFAPGLALRLGRRLARRLTESLPTIIAMLPPVPAPRRGPPAAPGTPGRREPQKVLEFPAERARKPDAAGGPDREGELIEGRFDPAPEPPAPAAPDARAAREEVDLVELKTGTGDVIVTEVPRASSEGPVAMAGDGSGERTRRPPRPAQPSKAGPASPPRERMPVQPQAERTATTPRAHHDLDAYQRSVLDEIEDDIDAHDLDWLHIGLQSRSDVDRFLARYDDPDAGIFELHRRLNEQVDVQGSRAAHALGVREPSKRPWTTGEEPVTAAAPIVASVPEDRAGMLERFKGWVRRGEEHDVYYDRLTPRDKWLYEGGQKTFSRAFYKANREILESFTADKTGQELVAAVVARGAYLKKNHPIRSHPFNVIEFVRGIRATIATGPTPELRKVLKFLLRMKEDE